MMTLREIIGKMLSVRALVIGDAIVDTYAFCRSERLCPEAPVPVLIAERLEHRSGGAANVFAQVKALCAEPLAFFDPGTVSRKTRYMVGNHLVLRVDDDKRSILDEEQKARALIRCMEGSEFDVVILSDYNKGWLTEPLCQFAIKYAKQKGILCIVDPKGGDWTKYRGATWVCPNDKEMLPNYDSWHGLVLNKRGADGLRLIYLDCEQKDVPATAKHVFDVTGAGDTVVAVFAAALAAGGTDVQAAQLANLAAGYVVGEVGTAVCPQPELIKMVNAL